jgi:hypothetical protein
MPRSRLTIEAEKIKKRTKIHLKHLFYSVEICFGSIQLPLTLALISFPASLEFCVGITCSILVRRFVDQRHECTR